MSDAPMPSEAVIASALDHVWFSDDDGDHLARDVLTSAALARYIAVRLRGTVTVDAGVEKPVGEWATEYVTIYSTDETPLHVAVGLLHCALKTLDGLEPK